MDRSRSHSVARAIALAVVMAVAAGCGQAAPTASAPTASAPTPSPLAPVTLALVHGTVIDGTGAEPIADGTVLISGDLIAAVGPSAQVAVPEGVKTIDLSGATVMPGFINAHVHGGFDESNLKAWAYGGVTTVRDEGTSPALVHGLSQLRAAAGADPKLARLVSFGSMIAVPGGYGELFVDSAEEARQAVLLEIEEGVDGVKVAIEDGYAGRTDLPKLTPEELKAIVETAHAHGLPVSGHITSSAWLDGLLDAGVDDVAHVPWDPIDPGLLRQMVADDVYLTPTFTVFRNYGAPVAGCVANVRDFVEAGGHVALGSDYGGGPGDFELGIPMYEIEQLSAAGMTPLQIVVASTLNAAHVMGLKGELGTLEVGKAADVLVVSGDPLADLQALRAVRVVVHGGVVIRDEGA